MNDLLNLVKTISTHRAVNNTFYQKWMHKPLSVQQIAVFALNYWMLTNHFPAALASLILNTDNVSVKVEYTKILYSEVGSGITKRAHSVLFEEFWKDLAQNLGCDDDVDMNKLKKITPVLCSTNDLITWQGSVYSKEYEVAVGAQLALEWQAYMMIVQLYEGARNYKDRWQSLTQFHESCEFFYAHIGHAEKEHKEESLKAALGVIEEGGKIDNIRYGFNKHLDLIATFWEGIGQSMDMPMNNLGSAKISF